MELIFQDNMGIGIRKFASLVLLFERFDLVCNIVEVDRNSMLTHKLNALHPDLGKFRLQWLRFLQTAALRHRDLVDAAFLGGLVNLSRNYLLQRYGLGLCLMVSFIRNLYWLEEVEREEPMIIILCGNITLLTGNSCVHKLFDRLVREKNSLVWILLR